MVLYKNYRNSIQWTSGYTGLLLWSHPGFDSSSDQSSIYFVFIFDQK
jgi:hypothetical protein